jgi:hypothetical protein
MQLLFAFVGFTRFVFCIAPLIFCACYLFEGFAVEIYSAEEEVLTRLVALVRRIDPDILAGFDIQRGSWGFLVARSIYTPVTFGTISQHAVH